MEKTNFVAAVETAERWATPDTKEFKIPVKLNPWRSIFWYLYYVDPRVIVSLSLYLIV
jgi:hypothetical protein